MNKHVRQVIRTAQQGFTIVELMIATLVFSVILIVITSGVLHFTTSYYKGINSSTTQNTARNVINAVSQAIEFGGGNTLGIAPTTGTVTTYCLGNQQFDFILGKEIDGASVKDALYQSPLNSSSGCVARVLGTSVPNSQELLGTHMRLAYFKIDNSLAASDGLYKVTVGVAYGDDDLLCSAALNGNPGGCQPSDPTLANINGTGLTCKSQTGAQFCDVSYLSTTVQTRIGG